MPAAKNLSQYGSVYHRLLEYAASGTRDDLEITVPTFADAANAKNRWYGFARALRREADAHRVRRNEEQSLFFEERANIADQWFIRIRLADGRASPNKAAGESYKTGPAILVFHHRGSDPFERALEARVAEALDGLEPFGLPPKAEEGIVQPKAGNKGEVLDLDPEIDLDEILENW